MIVSIKNKITNSATIRGMAYYAGWPNVQRLWRLFSVKRPTVFILMYHKIAPEAYPYYGASVTPSIFEKQIRIILKHYRVMALEELINRHPINARKNFIALTFDDGYRGIYRWAFPILRKYNLPATVFLTTDYIGSQRVLWHDHLAFILHRAAGQRFLADIDFSGLPANLAGFIRSFFKDDQNSKHKLKFLRQMTTDLKSYSADDRHRLLNELCKILRLETPFDFSDVMLCWKEVREMAKQNIFFGSHTCSHEPLSTLSPACVEAELIQSKNKIESQLQKQVASFAYPYGKEMDFTFDNIELVKQSGFHLAVTGIRGNETLPFKSPHTLRRRAVENTPFLFY